MLEAALIAICFVENTPVQGGERMVVLSDRYRFGVGYDDVRALWHLSTRHPHSMRETVQANNSPKVVGQWEQETAWRARCWYLLDDAVNCPQLGVHAKLRSLDELRRLIGDDEYYSGRMPSPTPRYRLPVK